MSFQTHMAPEPVAKRMATTARVLAFWLVFWLILAVLRFAPIPGLGSAAAPVAAGIATIAILLLAAGLLRIEGGTAREVGLYFKPKYLLQFVVGVGLGLAVVVGMMAVLLLLTPLEIEAAADSNVLAVLVISFVILFVLALMEEVAFRSYPLFRLRQAWGVRPAIYVTSIAFAAYHGLAFENLLGPGVWGLFYGWMAITTNSIALPTGFHVGLNWLQALLGMKPQYGDSIWELSIGASSGFFEVEALGLLMQLALLLVGIVIVEILVKKRNREA